MIYTSGNISDSTNHSAISKILFSFNGIFVVYVVITIIAALVQCYLKKNGIYTGYNNFIIFRNSFYHLINHQDLYTLFPAEHFDYYKYSPTFAFLIAPFTLLNNAAGLICWDLLNALVLFYSIKAIPGIPNKTKYYILWFVLLELLTSLQNSQSNALVCGLAVFTFNYFEKGKPSIAALFIALGIYIKIFSGLLILLALFYDKKIRFSIYMFISLIVLFFLPLLVVDLHTLKELYLSWGNLLKNDQSASTGLSVAGWLSSWFNISMNKNLLTAAGLLLLILPYVRIKMYSVFQFRLLSFGSLLIWLIIFNHKAESPTFIVSITGIALWYFTGNKNRIDTILIVIAFILTSLSPTDIFPRIIRNQFVIPYVLKAIPCIIIWAIIIVRLLINKREDFLPLPAHGI